MDNAREFTVRLQELLRRERLALGDFLVALADFDRRRLWVDLGYTSLFYFLHRQLGLSKGAAFYRKTAVELIHRVPEVVEPLRDGRLCLTTVVELSKVLTPENRDEVLPRFFELSKSEAKEVTAALRPDEAAPRREVVTAVRAAAGPPLALASPAPDPGQALVHPANHPKGGGDAPAPPVPAAATPLVASSVRRDTIEPLTAELNRLHVTVSRRFLEKLERARAALSHSHPAAAADEILEVALDLLLDRDAKRRGLVERPLPAPRPSSDPGRIPAHVRRAVWRRDGGRCQWPTADGGICGSTHRVELDHVVPRARGGPATAENLRCACRRHNLLAAREAFGDAWIDRYARDPRAGTPAAAPS